MKGEKTDGKGIKRDNGKEKEKGKKKVKKVKKKVKRRGKKKYGNKIKITEMRKVERHMRKERVEIMGRRKGRN